MRSPHAVPTRPERVKTLRILGLSCVNVMQASAAGRENGNGSFSSLTKSWRPMMPIEMFAAFMQIHTTIPMPRGTSQERRRNVRLMTSARGGAYQVGASSAYVLILPAASTTLWAFVTSLIRK
ncbi:MAG: hypothetical protein ACYTAN_04090 [Planctomycetota bacterium]|jgi:hypothetical protein